MSFITEYKERLQTRGDTFEKIFELADERKIVSIVETGCIRKPSVEDGRKIEWRGDGGSTVLFAQYAQDRGALFWSCDLSLPTLIYAQEVCEEKDLAVCFVQDDSVAFLEKFSCSIDLLYLDSFNYEPHNPMPAMIHCLKEVQAVEDKLHDGSIIAIDDLFGDPLNNPRGKPGLAIGYLLKRGWRIRAAGRQIVFTR